LLANTRWERAPAGAALHACNSLLYCLDVKLNEQNKVLHQSATAQNGHNKNLNQRALYLNADAKKLNQGTKNINAHAKYLNRCAKKLYLILLLGGRGLLFDRCEQLFLKSD
jgi:hypothetical protein